MPDKPVSRWMGVAVAHYVAMQHSVMPRFHELPLRMKDRGIAPDAAFRPDAAVDTS